MKMQIGKWGNSLAVRLPKDVVEECGFKLGDTLESETFKAAVMIAKSAADQSRRDAAIEKIRARAFELPADWKFDREEANWRPAMGK